MIQLSTMTETCSQDVLLSVQGRESVPDAAGPPLLSGPVA